MVDDPEAFFADPQPVEEACENPPDEPYPEPEEPFPDAELVVENDGWGSLFVRSKMDGGVLRETLVSADLPLFEKPSVEVHGALVAQEVEEAFITTPSLPPEIQPEVTTYRAQPTAGQTVVLTILHTSKISDQTLRTMINLADNTKAAILDAVNLYLDSNSLLVHIPGQRKIEIKYGAGKNGDLDLSSLEESKWPEYLEYLGQYTRLPELTVEVVDFHE